MEYRGPWPDIDIPDVSLYEVVFGGLDEQARSLTAFDHAETGEVLSFGELLDRVDSLATWLHTQGIGRGVVAIMLPNCPAYAIAFHGTLRAGATASPVNVAGSAGEISRQLRMTSAALLVTNQDLLATAEQAVAGLEHPIPVMVVDAAASDGAPDWDEAVRTTPDPPTIEVDPSRDVACLPVSSGTSGLPKAVQLTHRNLVANLLQFATALAPIGQRNSIVAFLPYSHIYSLTTTLNFGLLTRSTQLTMTSFRAHLFHDVVATRRPTVLFVVPAVAAFIARGRTMDEIDWSSVKLAVSGAAPLDGTVGRELEAVIGGRVVQGYGMTELSPVSHIIPMDRPDIPYDTIGQALPCVRFRVVDPDTGLDVEAVDSGEWSQPGELWVQGPNTMLGYLDNPEATGEALDGQGWVRTGDLVVVDGQGTVRVVDRIKELIKRRGFQIAPAELEKYLLEHPDVEEAAVVGVPQQSGDQVPHALLVLREGADPQVTPAEVLRWLNERTAQYKHVGRATVVAQLPRSAAGKVLRRQLLPLVG